MTLPALSPLAALDVIAVLKSASVVELSVLLLLACASIASWALIAMKTVQLRKARAQSVAFLETFWKASRLEAIYQSAQQLTDSPLSTFAYSSFSNSANIVWRYTVALTASRY